MIAISMLFSMAALAANSAAPPPPPAKFSTTMCTVTVYAVAHGSQKCGDNITEYTVTNSCTDTDVDCAIAEMNASICATITANRNLQRMLKLLPPCDGPEPPHNI